MSSSIAKFPTPETSRFLPDWVSKRFGEYKTLGETKDTEGTCEIIRKVRDGEASETIPDIRPYQEFVHRFMSFESPYKTMLLYHDTGTGKTRSAIALYNALYNTTPSWNVFVLTKKSLESVWEGETKKFLERKDLPKRRAMVHFVAYNGPNPYASLKRAILEARKKSGGVEKSMYIIEEAHNFVSQVYGNTKSDKRHSLNMYHHILRDLTTIPDTRVLCLTATPIVNNPVELTFLFNLLRPNIFSTNIHKFRSNFLEKDTSGALVLKKSMVNVFQRRIMGLVSYYAGKPKSLYATVIQKQIRLKMSSYMEDVYRVVEEQERSMGSQVVGESSATGSTFMSISRSACNFVFPTAIQQKYKKMVCDLNGRTRPQRSSIRRQLQNENKIDVNDDLKAANKIVDRIFSAQKRDYIASLRAYLLELAKEDNKTGHTIEKDKERMKHMDEEKLNLFLINETSNKSSLLNILYRSSSKMCSVAIDVIRHPNQIQIVYSTFVEMEGLEIMEMYLSAFGITRYDLNNKKGGVPKSNTGHFINLKSSERDKLLDVTNHKSNARGQQVRVVLASPSTSEGISVYNCRRIHILEPHWNENRMDQVIGRGRRLCSHAHLPREEWTVTVMRYFMTRSKGGPTADDVMFDQSMKKKRSIDSFLLPMQQVAVDCALWYNHHEKNRENFQCFRFPSKDLLYDPKAVTFRRHLEDDIERGNVGTNSEFFNNKTIELHKVYAIVERQLNDERKPYWMDMEHGYVYDFETEHLVGQVEKNQSGDGLFYMRDFGTYIITRLSAVYQFA
jgi:hypothetical protein